MFLYCRVSLSHWKVCGVFSDFTDVDTVAVVQEMGALGYSRSSSLYFVHFAGFSRDKKYVICLSDYLTL
jgi:hypothetical protein